MTDVDWNILQRSHVQKVNASVDLLTLAANGGCWLRQQGHKTTSINNEWDAPPRSSITASSDNIALVTDVHWNHNICAQVPVKRSDVHHTNASTSEYARKRSTDDVGMQIGWFVVSLSFSWSIGWFVARGAAASLSITLLADAPRTGGGICCSRYRRCGWLAKNDRSASWTPLSLTIANRHENVLCSPGIDLSVDHKSVCVTKIDSMLTWEAKSICAETSEENNGIAYTLWRFDSYHL